jgi:hypothetical protein
VSAPVRESVDNDEWSYPRSNERRKAVVSNARGDAAMSVRRRNRELVDPDLVAVDQERAAHDTLAVDRDDEVVGREPVTLRHALAPIVEWRREPVVESRERRLEHLECLAFLVRHPDRTDLDPDRRRGCDGSIG